MRGFDRRWIAGIMFLAACAGGPKGLPDGGRRPPGPAISVTDDAGRTVSLAAPARRVVSLAPSSTELLFAVGAGPQVVGRTPWCRYPSAALAVPVVGDGLDPNVEAVAAVHPDLVVLYQSGMNAQAIASFHTLGIPAVVLRQDRLADVARDARLLGTLTAHGSAGDSIARRLDSLSGLPAPPARARVAIVVWDNPPIVIGGGSFLDELGRLAGAENVFHDLPQASATVSLESIAARDPDFLAVVDDASVPNTPEFARRPEWRVVRAVRAGHILHLPGTLFGRPGPRAGEAIAAYARLLKGAR